MQGRDELGQWAIEPCELHRVYPPLADDTATGNGTEERGVTGVKRLSPRPIPEGAHARGLPPHHGRDQKRYPNQYAGSITWIGRYGSAATV